MLEVGIVRTKNVSTVLTVNIMSGGVSERVKVIPLAIFTVLMGAFIYPLIVNITWGANLSKILFRA